MLHVYGILQKVQTKKKADKAIAKTREFFESLGVSTHLKDYGLGEEAVDKIVKQLEDHGMTRLGEKGDVTPEVAREILNARFIIHLVKAIKI